MLIPSPIDQATADSLENQLDNLLQSGLSPNPPPGLELVRHLHGLDGPGLLTVLQTIRELSAGELTTLDDARDTLAAIEDRATHAAYQN